MATDRLSHAVAILVLALGALCGSAGAEERTVGINSDARMTPNGSLVVAMRSGGRWVECGRLAFDRFLRERELKLSVTAGADVRLRLSKDGGGTAHIDAATLDGCSPVKVSHGTALALRKLAARDLDLETVPDEGLEVTFAAYKSHPVLSLRARVEAVEIGTAPLGFPEQNTGTPVTMSSQFYSYPLAQLHRALKIDGSLDDVAGDTPFVTELCRPASGHPASPMYAWVRNDADSLYVAIDFTSDNTLDPGKDYGMVHVKTPAGVKNFKVCSTDQRWGRGGFEYTPRVRWQHTVLEFKIPLEEIGLAHQARGNVQLAFSLYGTAGAGLCLPAAAHDPQRNRFLIAYYDYNGVKIQGQFLANTGTATGTAFTIGDSVIGYNRPAVAYEAQSQRFLAVWTTGTVIKGQLVNYDGTLVGSSFDICSAANTRREVHVATDTVRHSFFVAWTDVRDLLDTNIWGRRVATDGTLTGAEIQVSAHGTNEDNPDVAFDGSANFLVVWHDAPNAGDIYGCRVSGADGSLLAEFAISTLADFERYPRVTCNPIANEFLVAWEHSSQVTGQRINASTGALTGAVFAISAVPGNISWGVPAWGNASQRYLVVWGDSRNAGDIYGQYVQASAALDSTEQPVSVLLAEYEYEPEVVYNSVDNNFLVVLYLIIADGSAYDLRAVVMGPTPGQQIRFPANVYTVSEAPGATAIQIQRTGPTTTPATVDYATSDGSGFAGTDYIAASGTASFAIGQSLATFNFTPINDSLHTGTRMVNLTLSNPTGGATLTTPSTALVTLVDDDALAFASGPSATPASVWVGQSVQFATAVNATAVTCVWDFKDGATATGATATHAFAAVGTYAVTVTATHADGSSATGTATVVVSLVDTDGDGQPDGADADDDNDGFSDQMEAALGSDPQNPASMPQSMAQPAPGGELNATKGNIKLNFAKSSGNDSLSVSGTLPIPAGFAAAGQKVLCDVGGVVKAFTLDERGKSTPVGDDSFKLLFKHRDTGVAAQTAKFVLKCAHGTFATALADDGLVNADIGSQSVSVPVTIIFNGQSFSKALQLSYKARHDAQGTAK